jgi:hypothetical protein
MQKIKEIAEEGSKGAICIDLESKEKKSINH